MCRNQGVAERLFSALRDQEEASVPNRILNGGGARSHALKPAHTEMGPPVIPRRDALSVVRIDSRFKTLHNGYFSFFQIPYNER